MLFLLCVCGGALFALVRFMPSYKTDPYFKYITRENPDEYSLVFGDAAVPKEYYALSFEGDILLDIDFIIEYAIDPFLFWDDDEQTLTVSTPQNIIRMRPGEASYTQNGERTSFSGGDTALYADSGKVFLPLSFAAEFYQIEAYVSDETKTVIIDSLLTERTSASVKTNNAPVRRRPDIKSDIAEKVSKDSLVYVFSKQSENDFLYVRTEDGAFGYIREKDVGKTTKVAAEGPVNDGVPLPAKYSDKPFTLVWDQIAGEGANNWFEEKPPALGIVSPTWLSLSDSNGNIKDTGAKSYAQNAKKAGYAVWPLFSNGFDAEITRDVLSSTEKREKVIGSLIDILREYGAEGVNIDFESYKIEDGYYYTQFLRELCVALRGAGFISSVDLPVPTLAGSPTDRAEIGRYADYIIVMAYDQHWANSPVKGPVAGYDWVLAGIENTLALVPPEKTVLGLPLYTRMWYEPHDAPGTVSSRDFSMRHVSELFELRGAKTTWEENTKYYRGEYEYEVDGVMNSITSWLETVDSLRFKAEIINDLELGGAACWKKGLEDEDVWKMLAEVVG